MLVKFSNVSGASVSMYEKDAKDLIAKMGHSGSIPSAIRCDDLSSALQTLEDALKETVEANPVAAKSVDDDAPAVVSVNVRAYPLIQLIKQSIQDKKALMWAYTQF